MKYETPTIEVAELCVDTTVANDTEVEFPMAGLLSAGSMPK